MILTPEYWEKLKRSSPSMGKNQIEDKGTYLLRYNTESDQAVSNHIDFIRSDNFSSVIDEVIDFFQSRKKSFMITLYDYINTEEEADYLLSNNFIKTGTYQTMVAPITHLLQPRTVNGFIVKAVDLETMLQDNHLEIPLRSFPDFFKTIDDARSIISNANKAAQDSSDTEILNFVAYETEHSKPVGSGALYLNRKWDKVASLSGASIHPDFRKQGLYSLLLYDRALYAHNLGYTHLMIQANTATSGPIVSSKGFVKVNEFSDYQYHIT